MVLDLVEEAVQFDSGGLALRGVLAYAATGRPVYRALVCPPHPNFAGDMENNVVLAAARELAREGATLRFDYRGVGHSEIRLPPGQNVWDFWQDVEDRQAFAAPGEDTESAWSLLDQATPAAPALAVGYSFGAVMAARLGMAREGVGAVACLCPPLSRVDCGFLARTATPTLVVAGTGDFVYSQPEMDRLVSAGNDRLHIVMLEGGDHFFRGEEQRLLDPLRVFWRQARGQLGERE